MKKHKKWLLTTGIIIGMSGVLLAGCGSAEEAVVETQEESIVEYTDENKCLNATLSDRGSEDLKKHIDFLWEEHIDDKAGSNNFNMNYIDGDYNKVPSTCMVSDGENLFITTMLASGVTGIHRYSLDSATNSAYDGTLVYEIPIPEDQLEPTLSDPEYGEPIAMGMYDKENLCVVMPTGEREHDFDKGTANDKVRFEKIPAFDVTYAREGNAYDTFSISECVDRPKLVGEWFYFERDLGEGIHGLFQRSIYTGKEAQIAEHYVGYHEETGLERLTYVLDEESLIAIRYNNQESEAIMMDVRSGSIESIEMELQGEVVGTYDGYVYFTGEAADYKLPLYRMKKGVWEPELVLSNTSSRYRYNFYQNTMFLLSEDDVFVIPLEFMGKDYSEYEKIRIYTAISLELAPPFPESGIWIWDGKLWTYSCLGELNSTLKVLGECEGIISQFTGQMEMQETQAAPGTISLDNQKAPSYEFISKFILFNDFMVFITGVEETAEIVINSCEYHEEWDLYKVEAALTGENGDKGMTANYMINCRYIGEVEGEDRWEIVDFLITNQSSYGV